MPLGMAQSILNKWRLQALLLPVPSLTTPWKSGASAPRKTARKMGL